MDQNTGVVPGQRVARLTHPVLGGVGLVALFGVIGFSFAGAARLLTATPEWGLLWLLVATLLIPASTVWVFKASRIAARKARVLVRSWTWWHPLWALVFFSMLVFRIREASAAGNNPVDAYGLLRVVPEILVGAILLVRLSMKRPFWLRDFLRGAVGGLGIYCLVCVASITWSVKPDWTAYKALEFSVDVSMMAAIVASANTWVDFKKLTDWTLCFFGLALAAVWVNMPFFPSSETWDGGRLTGVFPVESSNGIATEGAILGLIALCRLLPLSGRTKDRPWYSFVLVVSVVSMILTQTRVANIAFLFSVGLICLFHSQLRRMVLRCVSVVTPVVLVSIWIFPFAWHTLREQFITYMERNQPTGALLTLSGRTDWWAYGFKQWMQHPFTGIGAYAARFAVLDKLGVGSAAMMHNDWVEVFIGTSLWGLIPFAAALILSWWYLIRCIRSRGLFVSEQRQLALEMLACLGFLSLHSLVNDELSWHAPIMYLAVVAYAEGVRRRFRQIRQEDQDLADLRLKPIGYLVESPEPNHMTQ